MNTRNPQGSVPESEEQMADDQQTSRAKPDFEIPECCRWMMDRMMIESRPCMAGTIGDPTELGRLMQKMMKACCGSAPDTASH